MLNLPCAFPFEGNWNCCIFTDQANGNEHVLRCAFPFEGNWNIIFIEVTGDRNGITCDVLSRLKGMETRAGCGVCAVVRGLAMCFPVWREWKPMCCRRKVSDLNILRCAFPFEGNGNFLRAALASLTLAFVDLRCAFPFEGNWNFCDRFLSENLFIHCNLRCAFPFEGNWNDGEYYPKVDL